MPLFTTSNRFAHALTLILLLWSCNNRAALDPELLAGMSARALGPAAVSGRITAIDALHSNPNHMVIGAASGGFWISENGGLTWTPVFNDQPVASIGAVAINQSNPDIAYVAALGTLWGENTERGIFKTTDGGKTFENNPVIALLSRPGIPAN